MSEENVELIRSGYEDFNAGKPETVLGLLTPEATWTEPGGGNSPSGTFTGPESVGQDVLAKVGEQFEEFSANPEQLDDQGDTVVVKSRFKGKSKSGTELDTAAEQTWTLEDGKVTSMNNVIEDTDAWAAAWS